MKLSIIIPMYKVASYVERCIHSLETQDLPHGDYEIICINDGSPDDCREIVETLQQEFANIVLINQENQGVSMARNNALAVAKGEYILPIDPDDYIHANTLNQVYQRVKQDDIDVLMLSYEILNLEDNEIWKPNFDSLINKTVSGPELYFSTRAPKFKDPDRSWAILYRKELLDKYSITYPKDVPYLEDGQFLGKVFSAAKNCEVSNLPFYVRTKRLGSATNSSLFYSDRAAQGFIKAAAEMQSFQRRFSDQLLPEQYLFANHIIARFILLTLMPSASKRDLKTFAKRANQLKESNFTKIDCRGVKRWHRKYAQAYNISPYAFFLTKQVQLAHKLIRNKIRKKRFYQSP
jgi:glycosyltransferase involved in cell wall biosynthesis